MGEAFCTLVTKQTTRRRPRVQSPRSKQADDKHVLRGRRRRSRRFSLRCIADDAEKAHRNSTQGGEDFGWGTCRSGEVFSLLLSLAVLFFFLLVTKKTNRASWRGALLPFFFQLILLLPELMLVENLAPKRQATQTRGMNAKADIEERHRSRERERQID